MRSLPNLYSIDLFKYPVACVSSPIGYLETNSAKHSPKWVWCPPSPELALLSSSSLQFLATPSFLDSCLIHIPQQNCWQILWALTSKCSPAPNHFSPPQLLVTLLQAIMSSSLDNDSSLLTALLPFVCSPCPHPVDSQKAGILWNCNVDRPLSAENPQQLPVSLRVEAHIRTMAYEVLFSVASCQLSDLAHWWLHFSFAGLCFQNVPGSLAGPFLNRSSLCFWILLLSHL